MYNIIYYIILILSLNIVNFRRFFMKYIVTLNEKSLKNSACKGGCGECQTSCQSACKTSCTVANQKCENEEQK